MASESSNEFTYCGDLVGVSTLYANAPEEAYTLLSQFYNTAFRALEKYQLDGTGNVRIGRNIYMFSDSLIVTGDDTESFVKCMCDVYMSLLNASMLLRGGMVSGRLEFDPRRTRENFEKNLPRTERLAKASALEKSVKGARFVVEPELAASLIHPHRHWMTQQGYLGDLFNGRTFELQRSISPLPTGGGFEILYPVFLNVPYDNGVGPLRTDDDLLRRNITRVDYLITASSPEAAVHYKETKRLLELSLLRRGHMAALEEQ